jgi:hypothetical protein
MTIFVGYFSATVEQLSSQALCLSDLHLKSDDSFAALEKFVVLNRFVISSTRVLQIG